MTAVLPNDQNGAFGFNIDGFVYPQFLGIPLRAPTTQDIYNPGTRWQDNSVNPAVQYYTIGGGIWYEMPNTSFGVSSVTGTANQITASPNVGAVVLSIPSTFIAPGSIASTTTITAATGLTVTAGGAAITGTTTINTTGAAATSIGTGGTGVVNIGNATGGTVVTGPESVSGLLTASVGINTAPVVVGAGASPQTANGRSGQVTFSGVSIAAGATQSFVINNTAIAAIGTVILYSMVGATTGAALNIQSVTNVANTSSTIVVENGTGATTSTANITFTFLVLN